MPCLPHTLLFDRVLMSPDEGGLPGIPGSGSSGPTGIPGAPPSGNTPNFDKTPPPNLAKPGPWADPAPGGPPSGGQPPVFQQPTPPTPVQGLPTGGTFELSGWWRRVGATLIDFLIIAAMLVPLALIAFAILGVSLGGDDNVSDTEGGVAIGSLILLFLLYLVISLLYAPLTMSRMDGATPGKRAAGIRVVRADGLPITFGFAALREILIKGLLFGGLSQVSLGLASLLDYLWPLWDSEHRALHDMIAKTRVVRA